MRFNASQIKNVRHIQISLRTKFQGNQTIRLGEKRKHTDRNTDRPTYLNFIYIDTATKNPKFP